MLRQLRLLKTCSSLKKFERFQTSIASNYILKSKVPDQEFAKGNIAKFILEGDSNTGHLTALECLQTGRTYTHSQIRDTTFKWTGFLEKLNIQEGDVVGTFTHNYPEFASIMLGTAAAGATLSPMNSSMTASELTRLLTISQPKVMVYAPELEDTIKVALETVNQNPILVSIGPSKMGSNVLEIFDNEHLPFQEPMDIIGDEPFLMPFSSGSTGLPKGALLSHNAFVINNQQLLHPHFFNMDKATASQQKSLIVVIPCSHIGGLSLLLMGLKTRNKVYMMPQFDMKLFVSALITKKVSYLLVVPTLLNYLLAVPSFNKKNLPFLEEIYSGGSVMPTSLLQTFREKVGKDLVFQSVYGMTECLVTHATPSNTTSEDAVHEVLPNNECKIIDPTTKEPLSPNILGEICMKTPTQMIGYVNNEAATAEILSKDGWIHSKDIGSYDEKGHIRIVDRLKDLIKVKGLQVSPSEIEDTLIRHDKIKECAVVGMKHDAYGEVPKAFIVKADGDLSENEVHQYLKPLLAKYKQLEGGIAFIDELPKNNVGKIVKRLLTE